MRKLIGMWYMVFALVAIGNCAQYKQVFQADELKRCKSKCGLTGDLLSLAIVSSGEEYCQSLSGSFQANAVESCRSGRLTLARETATSFKKDCQDKCKE